MKGILIIFAFGLASCGKRPEEKGLSKELSAILDSVAYRDQHFRSQLDSVSGKFGADSDQIKELWILINQNDVKNQRIVSKVLDTNGRLTPDLVGEERSSTLFYVIQHAPHSMQKKYLPMLQRAVKNGDAKSEHLAMLEDRVFLKDGEMQKYGTQIAFNPETEEYLLLNVFEPDKLNERRNSMGLWPIEDYLKEYNFAWNVRDNNRKNAEYKEYLSKLKGE